MTFDVARKDVPKSNTSELVLQKSEKSRDIRTWFDRRNRAEWPKIINKISIFKFGLWLNALIIGITFVKEEMYGVERIMMVIVIFIVNFKSLDVNQQLNLVVRMNWRNNSSSILWTKLCELHSNNSVTLRTLIQIHIWFLNAFALYLSSTSLHGEGRSQLIQVWLLARSTI